MALRAFHANPSLGGFGGESSGPLRVNSQATEQDCDAFAQIVKELVDNAVDACQHSSGGEAKRIRIVIERMNDASEEDGEYTEVDHVLRVTVSDNGIGMDNIQDCVNAFRTSKAGNEEGEGAEHTAGRYGIGLTLCLLHAQRLVPNSCASITSATKDSQNFTRASYIVDTDGDSVLCVKQEHVQKLSPEESGTAVSLLVPGGQTALRAWPRLAEYFARFHLSLGLKCGLEVLAPSLSSIPLFIRPASQRGNRQQNPSTQVSSASMMEEDAEQWTSGLSDTSEVAGSDTMQEDENASEADPPNATDARRAEIFKAANTYLKRPINIENIAHSMHLIGRGSRHNQDTQPTLGVDMIVYGPNEDDDDEEEADSFINDGDVLGESPCAKLMLVRMVNGIPLLDGAEATACGLVQGIFQQQSTWNSFGLHVAPMKSPGAVNIEGNGESDDESANNDVPGELFVPTYAVRDSDQVAPFIRSGTHDLYDMDNKNEDDSLSADDGSVRNDLRTRNAFLPAHLRVGNVLLVVQIHAKPSSLPLPTLSKGRLPMNNHPITSALELGIMACLGSLQKTSPGLLLTTIQLKETIRDTRYVPALSAALALVVSKVQNSDLKASMLQKIRGWSPGKNSQPLASRNGSTVQNDSADSSPPSLADSSMDATTNEDESARISVLGPLLESRLRLVCAQKKETRRTRQSRGESQDCGSQDSDGAVGLEEFLHGEPDSVPESQMRDDDASTRGPFSAEGLSVSSSSSSTTENSAASDLSTWGRRFNPNEDDLEDDEWW